MRLENLIEKNFRGLAVNFEKSYDLFLRVHILSRMRCVGSGAGWSGDSGKRPQISNRKKIKIKI
jgi:hypothetical protein